MTPGTESPTLHTVRIGRHEWTTRNLDRALPGSYAPDGDEARVAELGRLYTHEQALAVAAAVPGFHLPTREEAQDLIDSLGGAAQAGGRLRTGGGSGFEARMAGYRDHTGSAFVRLGAQTGFWTATIEDDRSAWKLWLMVEDDAARLRPVWRSYGDSVRLVRDEVTRRP